MSGIATIDNLGVYGIMGSPEASNMPGARDESVSWTDSTDNLWLFGGRGYPGSGGTSGLLNDLWRFDGTYWTWMLGDSTINSPGVYGTMGSPEASNVPGARYESVSWMDNSGNLWLFGGSGYGGSGGVGWLNDLWRFDGAYWTWMSGSNTLYSPGVYGIMGSPEASNVPGARYGSLSWTDNAGNLWLFGGFGYDGSGNWGFLNDLWRFDGTYWTWMSGDSTINISGAYGTLGSPEASNVPGGRYDSVSWMDSSGNMWLFGGNGYDGSGSNGWLNDLWRYNL
jgi:N-acetylneuraminic acid mutarotase